MSITFNYYTEEQKNKSFKLILFTYLKKKQKSYFLYRRIQSCTYVVHSLESNSRFYYGQISQLLFHWYCFYCMLCVIYNKTDYSQIQFTFSFRRTKVLTAQIKTCFDDMMFFYTFITNKDSRIQQLKLLVRNKIKRHIN